MSAAAFVAVGSELLGTTRHDTNSLRVAALLRRHGFELRRKAVVGDWEEELAAELSALFGRYELLLVCGGLGPTSDDVTREAVALACGLGLALDEAVLADIEAKFASFGRTMPASNRRQAMVLAGAAVLANRRGTAPGLRFEHRGTTCFLLPGPPRELEGLLAAEVEPWLAAHGDGGGITTRVLKVACLPESEVEERLAPAYGELGRERVTLLSAPGEIRVELSAAGSREERERELDRMAARAAQRIGPAVFSHREDETLEGVVGRLLAESGASLATAESCTGGLVAARITAVPGSSGYFLGGVVAYADEVKERLVAVPREELERHGAVSEPVARSLAEGARRTLGASHGIGITGIAGPAGGTPDKPVGLVHLAVAGPERDADHRRVIFPGDRERVRQQAAQLALEMLRRRLLESRR
ncbi:MAG TPA: competence/damage-inducible protein A [Thermoanaerobaculia bacterium]|nr:competence/damage-inducible protein A [Thermoanaerobaculia bacterium]